MQLIQDNSDDTEFMRLIAAMAQHLGSSSSRVIKISVALLALDLGVKFELPRKEKEHAG